MSPSDALLEVRNLSTFLPTPGGVVRAVDNVSLTINRAEVVGIVGESGAGKSMLGRSLLNLLPRRAVRSGEVLYEGKNILKLELSQLRELWGDQLSVIFQDPMTSLNPTMRIERQITESLRLHLKLDRDAAHDRALELLRMVGIPDPERRLRSYPHELSGGMRQRVAIAIGIACSPRLLVADEPTTALDVTIQRQILDLLENLQEEIGMSIVLVTHDLGVVANRADRVAVMYAGRIVEVGPAREIFANPRHHYTSGLIATSPGLAHARRQLLPVIPGRQPIMNSPPASCTFAPRCAAAQPRCLEEVPQLTGSEEHAHACFFPVGTERGDAALAEKRASAATRSGGHQDEEGVA